MIDSHSRNNKSRRIEAIKKIQNMIAELTELQYNYSPNSAKYKSLEQMIDQLTKEKISLSQYQKEQIYSAAIEYGINNKNSLGLNVESIRNSFDVAQEDALSNEIFLEIFYKRNLLKNKRHIFSIQPKLVFNNLAGKEEVLTEFALLGGKNIKKGKLRVVLDSAVAVGHSICTKKTLKRQYYGISLSETMILPYSFMLNNFTKHYFRTRDNLVYYRTIYEQISIAKTICFPYAKQWQLNIQLGYFWDRSLSYPSNNASGGVFSLWTEI